jgi:hypothetical protein
LKQIYDGELPDYLETIRKLGENIGVKEKVFSHLRDSSYLDEVYKISDPEYLLTNVLILVYRTYLLLTSPELKKKNAQISSTIEEMAVLLKLEGKESLVFEATKHWILNWREEGFSQDLAKLI